ncbi:unnamed protein product (macronuclear) [Paramecium tetraurelia]|uniref:Enkurin domain-containing protein n=1 Tax=Paramecium tetraurelia TaxID=5888 RepID=A0D8G6_PARTE|nr:uncharacterized protein GSPATT00014279001 [Paramecium tetraurelia]CAK79333.1 unnamed protein product [Paramecium tetraurelia]|eukprot:XP_001446730.1 hypothetical protein (macronuclear) [Paramecium tetraurelia strain d4-2]
MSYDISQQFIEFRKQIMNKTLTTPATNTSKIQTISTPSKKQEFSVDILKQSICKNVKRLKVKSAISSTHINYLSPDIPLSPQKQKATSPIKKQPYKSPQRLNQNEPLRSPNKQIYSSTSKSQQSQLNTFQMPQTYRQSDYIDQQSQIKLYSSKYQKIMNEEQGLYYSQLQTKLDQLSSIIGNQDDRQRNLLEIDNMINQSKQINAKSRVQKHLDSLQFESKALQSDLNTIKTKISRFSDFTDN